MLIKSELLKPIDIPFKIEYIVIPEDILLK